MLTKITGSGGGFPFSLYSILLLLTAVFSVLPASDTWAASSYEKELLQYINDYRADSGLSRLTFDRGLERLAGTHSRHMSQDRVLDHDNFDGRFRECGRSCCVENVGWNYPTPQDQIKAWKRSEGHNKNLLNRQIKRAGISKIGPFITFFACD